MEEYKVSKKINRLMTESCDEIKTAEWLIRQANELHGNALRKRFKAWDLFYKEHPEAGANAAYEYLGREGFVRLPPKTQ